MIQVKVSKACTLKVSGSYSALDYCLEGPLCGIRINMTEDGDHYFLNTNHPMRLLKHAANKLYDMSLDNIDDELRQRILESFKAFKDSSKYDVDDIGMEFRSVFAKGRVTARSHDGWLVHLTVVNPSIAVGEAKECPHYNHLVHVMVKQPGKHDDYEYDLTFGDRTPDVHASNVRAAMAQMLYTLESNSLTNSMMCKVIRDHFNRFNRNNI